MMDLLEQEAERLKEKYPGHHRLIEDNLKWVNAEMAAVPGSVAIQEGLIALSTGLPSLTGRRPRGAYKAGGTKRS
jgi:hypothetical protein